MNVFNGSQGLPERAEPAGQAHRSQHCLLFAVDVAGFTDRRRDDQVQLAVRRTLYNLVPGAFDDALVGWAECLHEDRGDGMLVIVPMRMPSARVVDPLLPVLGHRLGEHNRIAAPAHRIQLRAAVHIGEVHRDGYGLAGESVNHLFRLLDAPALKRALAESGGDLALIASAYFYDSVLRHRPAGIDPGTFWPVDVAVKQTRAKGWVHLPHAPEGTPSLQGTGDGLAVPDGAEAAEVGTARAAAGGSDNSRHVHGTVLGDGAPARTHNQGIAFLGNVEVHGDVVAGDKIIYTDRDQG